MELRGLLVAEHAIKKDENLAIFLHKIGGEFTILPVTYEELENGGYLEDLTDFNLREEEVLLLCPENRWVLKGKELKLAVLAYGELGGSYSFPDASYVVEGIQFLDRKDLVRRYQREKQLPWTIMETKRLIIREETPEDAVRLKEIYQSPSIQRFIEPLFELEREQEYLRNYYKYIYSFYEYGVWHWVLKDTGLAIGRGGLTPKTYEDGAQGAELGYVVDEAYQGQGYCMEACREIIRYAIEELEMDHLYCLIRPENEHSERICKKLGFEYETEVFSEGRNMKRYILKLHME